MIKRLISIILLVLAPVLAIAGPIQFSFVEDAADWPFLSRHFAAGTVTGLLFGLADNGVDLAPTSIQFTSDMSPLGLTSYIETPFAHAGGFTIVDGNITAANLLLNFVDPGIGHMQMRFNFVDTFSPLGANNLYWNGSTGPVAGMGNTNNGFAGATYSSQSDVPEPASLALFALGLIGFCVIQKKRS